MIDRSACSTVKSLPLVPITAAISNSKSCHALPGAVGASSYGPKTVDGHAK
ncbi:Uncharacterised protein [Mycobacterium tuberculosis]|uniref:Uncharacterized protein n=1 Tax=Mycobacterium tuberculosis TaxID=1773 RepID=A0A655I218_MYCTX|nr:Uncharacterised protein [Mycobacterium tuberculosis]COV39701.1 Uncharacterised protein [Mycobacterium tuberculosis]COW44185.1 Uncharacterised protein [Mycobacterium tuberculosis]COX07094.1 Uncharacterised protein [Mycobacterium tuberculosis]COX19564.1 Uncharacterised protein [Mycobacterium tuberculosis]